jgi:hypothetical protein
VKDVELEEITGTEEDILSDSTKAPGGAGVLLKPIYQRMTEILSRCTKTIGKESRPAGKDRENLPGYFEPHWAKAFSNDRGFALIRLRQLSLGDMYTFSEVCPGCSKDLKRISVDLSALKVSSVDLDKISKSGGIFQIRLPSGLDVQWKILRGEDEPAFEEVREGQKTNLMTALLYMRIVSIGGVKPKFEDIRRMSARERAALRTGFDEIEGGLETEITIECDNPRCKTVFKRILNIGRPDFFFPSEIPSDSKQTSLL